MSGSAAPDGCSGASGLLQLSSAFRQDQRGHERVPPGAAGTGSAAPANARVRSAGLICVRVLWAYRRRHSSRDSHVRTSCGAAISRTRNTAERAHLVQAAPGSPDRRLDTEASGHRQAPGDDGTRNEGSGRDGAIRERGLPGHGHRRDEPRHVPHDRGRTAAPMPAASSSPSPAGTADHGLERLAGEPPASGQQKQAARRHGRVGDQRHRNGVRAGHGSGVEVARVRRAGQPRRRPGRGGAEHETEDPHQRRCQQEAARRHSGDSRSRPGAPLRAQRRAVSRARPPAVMAA